VVAWMAAMLLLASLALAHVWKQNRHAADSRELARVTRERDALSAEVLLLEAEVRALSRYSRVEAAARKLGLVNPGLPVLVAAGGGAGAEAGTATDTDNARQGAAPVRAARWKGLFR